MKKIKILITLVLFVLSFFVHFIYNWFPNFVTSVFFPVNESIWEHMKIVYTGILISSIIEYLIYKKLKIRVNNFTLNIAVTSILSIVIYLIIYLIIDKFISHNLIVSIVLLFIVFILSQVISYKLINLKSIKYEKIFGMLIIVISYIAFAYLTYNPIKSYIFKDPISNTYGIKYNIVCVIMN